MNENIFYFNWDTNLIFSFISQKNEEICIYQHKNRLNLIMKIEAVNI